MTEHQQKQMLEDLYGWVEERKTASPETPSLMQQPTQGGISLRDLPADSHPENGEKNTA